MGFEMGIPHDLCVSVWSVLFHLLWISGPTDEDEFFDAQDSFPEEFVVSVSIPQPEGLATKTHK